MKEIVVVSGKGGTGKTSITAALGAIVGNSAVLADCDVDAANLHILFDPQNVKEKDFWGGKTAYISRDLCDNCGICAEGCRFDAITTSGNYNVDPLKCEGCSLCEHLCPNKAIKMVINKAGRYYSSQSRFGNWFISAELFAAQENSGKLVNTVKSLARQVAAENNISQIIIDGPPGISCPTISSLSGASLAVIVTEATKSGYHDLARIIELIKQFRIKAVCIVNKFDLNNDLIDDVKTLCSNNSIDIVSKIPFNNNFNKSLQKGLTLMEIKDGLLESEIENIWKEIKRRLN